MRFFLLPSLLLLCACVTEGARIPSLSGNPSKMSADTLCYRAAYAKEDPALIEEVKARNLDCGEILGTQPF